MDSNERPLWELIVELLPAHDPETEWWTIKEIAPLLGIKPRALMKHASDLWPTWEGQYRLKYSHAVALVRRVVVAGRKLPSRESIEQMLQSRGETPQ